MSKPPAEVVLRAFSEWLDAEIARRVRAIETMRRLDTYAATVQEGEADSLFQCRRKLHEFRVSRALTKE